MAWTLRGNGAPLPHWPAAEVPDQGDAGSAGADELQAAITARDAQGFDVALAMVLPSTDQAAMDAIRREIGEITEGEKTLLAARDAEVQPDGSRVQRVAVLIGFMSRLTRAAVEFYLSRKASQ